MRTLLTATLFQAAFLVPTLGYAGQDIPLEQLPAPVRATVEKETQGGKVTDIEKDRERGQVIYEVEFTLDGKEWELDIAEDGKLLERRPD